MSDLCIVRGDSHDLAMTFTQNGSILDITNYLITFTAKDNFEQTDANAVLQVSGIASGISDGVNAVSGIYTIPLTHTQTSGLTPNTYKYDIQTNNAGSISTPVVGNFIVKSDVTETI